MSILLQMGKVKNLLNKFKKYCGDKKCFIKFVILDAPEIK
jgi:hypothetical protein